MSIKNQDKDHMHCLTDSLLNCKTNQQTFLFDKWPTIQ